MTTISTAAPAPIHLMADRVKITAYYTNSSVGVLVRLHDANAVKYGDAEGDTLTGIEHLVGSRL